MAQGSSSSLASVPPVEHADVLAPGRHAQTGPELVGPGSLVLHEGIPHPTHAGCSRWPETLRLRNVATGQLIRGRCRATNLCDYCAKLAAVETSEALALDAVEHGAPEVWACLTTRTACKDPEPFHNARRLVLRALRRRWPDCEAATLVEFTTGYGPRSGGRRRPHWNLLLKGIPPTDLDQVQDVISRVWCQHIDALPGLQHVGRVTEAGGLMRYLALHFQKESQAPPKGWRGHRFTSTRGYFPDGATEARKRARAALKLKRELWKLDRLCHSEGVDLEGEERLRIAEQFVAVRAAESWELKHLSLKLPGIASRSG